MRMGHDDSINRLPQVEREWNLGAHQHLSLEGTSGVQQYAMAIVGDLYAVAAYLMCGAVYRQHGTGGRSLAHPASCPIMSPRRSNSCVFVRIPWSKRPYPMKLAVAKRMSACGLQGKSLSCLRNSVRLGS